MLSFLSSAYSPKIGDSRSFSFFLKPATKNYTFLPGRDGDLDSPGQSHDDHNPERRSRRQTLRWVRRRESEAGGGEEREGKLASSSKSKWSSHRLTNGHVIAARNDVNHELVRRAVAQVVEKMRDKRCCCLWRHKQADCNSARVTLGSWTWISVSRSELVKNPMIGSGLIKEYVLGFVTHVSVAACAFFIYCF